MEYWNTGVAMVSVFSFQVSAFVFFSPDPPPAEHLISF